jgi:hypothetical protein
MAVVCILLLVHCALAKHAFYDFADRPYPALRSAVAGIAGADNGVRGIDSRSGEAPGVSGEVPGRCMAFSPVRSPQLGFPRSLELNFPSVYGILSWAGYDPLVAGMPDWRRIEKRMHDNPVATAAAFGVRWLVVYDARHNPKPGSTFWFGGMEQLDEDRLDELKLLKREARVRLRTPEVTILEIPHAAPMACLASAPGEGLPVRFDGSGAAVNLRSAAPGGSIVLNVLWRPEFSAQVDGRKVACKCDDFGRVVVSVPPGAGHLVVRFCPPWRVGIVVGLLLLCLGGAMTCKLDRDCRKISAI